jgi:hypothetical protein
MISAPYCARLDLQTLHGADAPLRCCRRGADYQVGIKFDLPANKLVEAQADEFGTYLYGYVDYIDVFGGAMIRGDGPQPFKCGSPVPPSRSQVAA